MCPSLLCVLRSRYCRVGLNLTSPFANTSGSFSLTYEGEVTSPIAYDADSRDMTATLANISALAASSLIVETTNCSTPEITCGWLVTFIDVYGDVALMSWDDDDLGGNGAELFVMEKVQGQNSSHVAGSPAVVSARFDLNLHAG